MSSIFDDLKHVDENSTKGADRTCFKFFHKMFEKIDNGMSDIDCWMKKYNETMNGKIECPFLHECKAGKKAIKENKRFLWNMEETVTQGLPLFDGVPDELPSDKKKKKWSIKETSLWESWNKTKTTGVIQ